MPPQVDTKAVSGYRELRFNSIDECISEVNRILSADGQGKLKCLGNWTCGQVMSHVAAWIEYAYEGFPMPKAPFFIRWILRLRRNKMLNGKMPRGIRIPGIPEGTKGIDDLPTQAAGERLIKALRRLASPEPAKFDSPAFGKLSEEERVKLNLRHAELHLGYLNY